MTLSRCARIQRALDLGVTFFDTSDVYGCRAQRATARASAGRPSAAGGHRHQVRQRLRRADAPGHRRRRQPGRHSPGAGSQPAVASTPITLISTSSTWARMTWTRRSRCARRWKTWWQRARYAPMAGAPTTRSAPACLPQGPHCASIQQRLNIFEGNAETLAVCEQFNLASINRGPLAQGLLTGKFSVGLADACRRRALGLEPAAKETWRCVCKKLEQLRGRARRAMAVRWRRRRWAGTWARSAQTDPHSQDSRLCSRSKTTPAHCARGPLTRRSRWPRSSTSWPHSAQIA